MIEWKDKIRIVHTEACVELILILSEFSFHVANFEFFSENSSHNFFYHVLDLLNYRATFNR